MKRALLGLGVLGTLWLAGFAVFLAMIWPKPLPAAAAPDRADAIVVLTGGADRIAEGIALLRQGAASQLLISGVGPSAGLHDLMDQAGIDPGDWTRFAQDITLGHEADSTHGNALETAIFAKRRHVTSLIVVTAAYHMPRALVELQSRLPGVALLAHPVRPPALRPEAAAWSGARWWGLARLLAGEYTKYLAARAGLADLAASLDHPRALLGQAA